MTDVTKHATLPMPYDDNITLIGYTEGYMPPLTEEDQYYVLMVTDTLNIDVRPDRDYWKKQYGWVGLECVSKPERVYISKQYNSRRNGYRGNTMIVTVKDVSRCCVLSALT